VETIWKVLWEHNPNAMVAVDLEHTIRFVNPSFCTMFRSTAETLIGASGKRLLGDMEEFSEVWNEDKVLRTEREFPDHGFYARQLVFPIRSENIIACVIVDQTEEYNQRMETLQVRRDTIERVNEVVDNQMKVAQEIAGLLGEATAQTKASLVKLVAMIGQENGEGG